MRRILISIFLIVCGLIVFGASKKGSASKLIDHASYGAYALNAETGEIISQTSQVSLVPASVMKIITTATALQVLGPDFTFHTQLGYVGKVDPQNESLTGNLVVKGGCDPAFYSEYFTDHYRGTFEQWAKAIAEQGIKKISGDIILDLSKLEGPMVPGGWLWEDIGNYYGASVSALTYLDNTYSIHLSTTHETGSPALLVNTTPQIENLLLHNQVYSSIDNGDHTLVFGAPGSTNQVIEGTIPIDQPDFSVKAAMPNPSRQAALEFMRILKIQGVTLEGNVVLKDRDFSSEMVVVADKLSPPLKDLLVPLNQESINLFAEHLLREIGRKQKGSSSLTKSLEAVREFWTDRKIFLDGYYQTDGSGLSRSNGICPRTLVEILRYMYADPNRTIFFNSLPLAGQSGTLKNSFVSSPLKLNLQAKTGSMTRVRSLAGLFTAKSGEKIIFTLMVNNFQGSQANAGHLFEDQLNRWFNGEKLNVESK
jgi:D-alanyl-D-alanine carboxypeptidase/D-alanyl-D-alanine-endopeptidase (penicillin-binding protein 4)